MASDSEINDHLQRELRDRGLEEVPANEAARWLDDAGLLNDSSQRPGLPLRNRLRDGRVAHSEQRPPGPNGRWFIRRRPSETSNAENLYDMVPVVRQIVPHEDQAGGTPVLELVRVIARDRGVAGIGSARVDGTWLLWPSALSGCHWGVVANSANAGARLIIETNEGAAANERLLEELRSQVPDADRFEWSVVHGRARCFVALDRPSGSPSARNDGAAAALSLVDALRELQTALVPSLDAKRTTDATLADPQAMTEALLRPRRRPVGLSAAERRAVENRAVERATAILKVDGWNVRDVGATHSYDLHCTRGTDRLHVEVKGTTGPPRTINLTANEVDLAISMHPDTALIVIFEIKLERSDEPVAGGGSDMVICPWLPEPSRLRPTAYAYDLS